MKMVEEFCIVRFHKRQWFIVGDDGSLTPGGDEAEVAVKIATGKFGGQWQLRDDSDSGISWFFRVYP